MAKHQYHIGRDNPLLLIFRWGRLLRSSPFSARIRVRVRLFWLRGSERCRNGLLRLSCVIGGRAMGYGGAVCTGLSVLIRGWLYPHWHPWILLIIAKYEQESNHFLIYQTSTSFFPQLTDIALVKLSVHPIIHQLISLMQPLSSAPQSLESMTIQLSSQRRISLTVWDSLIRYSSLTIWNYFISLFGSRLFVKAWLPQSGTLIIAFLYFSFMWTFYFWIFDKVESKFWMYMVSQFQVEYRLDLRNWLLFAMYMPMLVQNYWITLVKEDPRTALSSRVCRSWKLEEIWKMSFSIFFMSSIRTFNWLLMLFSFAEYCLQKFRVWGSMLCWSISTSSLPKMDYSFVEPRLESSFSWNFLFDCAKYSSLPLRNISRMGSEQVSGICARVPKNFQNIIIRYSTCRQSKDLMVVFSGMGGIGSPSYIPFKYCWSQTKSVKRRLVLQPQEHSMLYWMQDDLKILLGIVFVQFFIFMLKGFFQRWTKIQSSGRFTFFLNSKCRYREELTLLCDSPELSIFLPISSRSSSASPFPSAFFSPSATSIQTSFSSVSSSTPLALYFLNLATTALSQARVHKLRSSSLFE